MFQVFRKAVPENSDESGGSRREKRSSIGSGILIIYVVTLIAYSSVFSAGFNWDDDDHVIRLMNFGGMEGLFRIWFEPGATIQYYPLIFSAFWLQVKLWGLNPFGFHLVNIVLHAGNSLLLWFVLKKLDIPGAFWAGCLFAIHPIHVESVAWVTELKNILSAFFYLLAFLSYHEFSGAADTSLIPAKRQWHLYAISLTFFCCALLSKTVTCTLPAVILLLTWWQMGRLGRREIVPLLPFFGLAVILGLFTVSVESDYLMAKGPEWDFSLVERLLIAGRVTWFHAGKIFWPHPLIFNYPRWNLDAAVWWQYLFPAAAIALPALLWYHREMLGRGPLTACLFILGTNFPVLGFLNVYSMRFSFVADHYYYIANAGFLALFCAALNMLQHRWPAVKVAVTAFFWVIVAVFSILTWQQGKIYANRLTLFNDTINKNPDSWLSYGNRGLYYANEGRYDLAMVDLEKTLALKPDEADALHNRGRLYYEQREYTRALADFDRAVQIRPWRADYYLSRSLACRDAGLLDKALEDAGRIVAARPEDSESYLLRASILALLDRLAQARDDLSTAATLVPDDPRIYANRGLIFYRQGLLAEALRDFDTALRLDSNSAATYFNRGLARAAGGDVFAARSDLLRARELGYELDDAEFGLILSRKGTGSRGK